MHNSFLLVDNITKLASLVDNWKEREFALDTEFTTLNLYDRKIIALQIYTDAHNIDPVHIQFNFDYTYTRKEANPNGGRAKIDVAYDYSKTDAIDFAEALPYLHKLLDGAKVVTANGKVEINTLEKYGLDTFTIVDDVNLMNWMLDVSTPSGLKDGAKKFLGMTTKSYEDTIGQKADNIDWTKVDFLDYAQYGANDVYMTWKLRAVLREELNKFPALVSCYENIELPLIPCVARTERLGVSIDLDVLAKQSKEIAVAIKTKAEEIYDKIGLEFNLGSSKQLAEILFDKMGMPIIERSKAGNISVSEAVLLELAYRGYSIADDIIEYRKLLKLQGTYIDKLPKIVDPDGRLRGSFNQAGTETGRFSSSNPNLQNMPNNKKFPVKQAFVAKKGYSLIVVDWSTIEIRVMAHESKDSEMTDTLRNLRDVHQETTDRINNQTGLSLARGDGKTVNFAVLYGMSALSLSHRLNAKLKEAVKLGLITPAEYALKEVTEKVAQTIIDGYYQAYNGFDAWGKQEVYYAKQSGWVWTIGGRRRPVRELYNKKTFSAGQRKVINTIIQGGAGDLMKLAIVKLEKMYLEKGYDANTLLYIHDEFVIEVKDSQAEACLKDVIDLMQNIFPACDVPILCEGDIFDNWDGLKSKAGSKHFNDNDTDLVLDYIIYNIL